MKKTLLTFSVLAALACCTLAFAAYGEGSGKKEAHAAPAAKISENNANYGVSIGTVEAQLYSESGLYLDYFEYADYVAKTSDGTYMGFKSYSELLNDEETNEKNSQSYVSLVAIYSEEAAITIPDSIKVGEKNYPVKRIDSYWELYRGFNERIKKLTIPSPITYIYNDYDFDRYLDCIYMLGSAPRVDYNSFRVAKIYVCNEKDYSGYINNSCYSNSGILPYGWDFKQIIVNVEKNGEFAETYLTNNVYDWGAVQDLKVTGNINEIDLNAIKNLTALIKLDLSETSISSLPSNFLYGKRYLTEVKLPASLENIGSNAFNGCTSLEKVEINAVKTIGAYAFLGCSSLSYINLTGVEMIRDYAFSECTSLNGIDLSTVVNIAQNAFRNCKSLTNVDLSEKNLEFIGPGAFYGAGLKEIIIPEGISMLYSLTFSNCANLISVIFPLTLERIYEGVFSNCTSLSEVKMNTGLKHIESRAFYGCSALENVSIPATVKYIGSSAFNGTGIKNFKCYAVVPPTSNSSFIGEEMDMSRTYLYVPPFSKDFYRNKEYWSDFYLMKSIEEPVDYILVDRPLTINLEEEDNEVVADNPEIVLTTGIITGESGDEIGQLTAKGEGTLSAGRMSVDAVLGNRYYYNYQYCPTLINHADKMRADNVTINMWFNNQYRSNEWHFISIPFDVKISDIMPGDGTYWAIRRYDSAARAAGETSETWVNLTNADTMVAGEGYIISTSGKDGELSFPRLTFSSGNSSTKNNLFQSNDVVVSLTEYPAEFAHNRSWNLIGNPYPCYFDMHCLNEEFTAPVTVWNCSSYVAYSPVDDDLVLSPYEAFFVQCPLDTKDIIFKEIGRLHSNEGMPLYKIPSKSEHMVSVEDRNVFNFELSNNDSFDRARIVLNPEACMEYEVGRDASKFFADGSACGQIYVAGDVPYSICERPVDEGIATLGVRTTNEDIYTLTLSGRFSTEWHVILTDREMGISVDLTENDYQFIGSKDAVPNRFSVKFQIGTETGVDSLISKFGDNAVVTVTSINGQNVFKGRLTDIAVPSAGIYVVSKGKETRKVVLK